MFNQLLSIILIVILVGSLVTQVEISLVNALVDPATGIKTSSKFGTLQIDRSEYDVTYVNSTSVRINGTVSNLYPGDDKVTILVTLADGSTKGSQIASNNDGTFQISLPLDSNSQKGTYSVSASYAQNTIGALTFTVKLVPVATSALPIKPHIEQPKQNSINNVTQITQSTSNSLPNLQTASKIPGWVQHVFLWYGQGQVSEDELLGAIKFLVNSGIIQLDTKYSAPNSTTSSNLHPQPNINTQSENLQNINSNVTSNKYPVNLQIKMNKDQISSREFLIFQIDFIPIIPNTPVKIQIKNSTGGIVYDTGVRSLKFNEDANIGYIKITTVPDLIPSGKYTIEVQFGPDDQILGKQSKQFTYDQKSDYVQKIHNYFPTVMDIGTNFNYKTTSDLFDYWSETIGLDPCVLSCKQILSEEIDDKTIYPYDESGRYLLSIIEFESASDAKKYAATSNQWQGTPSSAGNFNAVTDTSAINSDSKQCFDYGGGYDSANGVYGLLKCTNGQFVVEVNSNNEIAHEIANAVIKKIG